MATVELNKENFEQVITGNDMVMVDFWGDRAGRSSAFRRKVRPRSGMRAPWCGPCRSFAPTYEAASEKFPNVVFAKVNTEEQQELGGHFGIRSIPTLMVFRQQVILFSQPGALPASGLEGVITQSLALDMDKVRADIAASQSGAEKQG